MAEQHNPRKAVRQRDEHEKDEKMHQVLKRVRQCASNQCNFGLEVQGLHPQKTNYSYRGYLKLETTFAKRIMQGLPLRSYRDISKLQENETVRCGTCTIETGKIKTPTTQERGQRKSDMETCQFRNSRLTASAGDCVGGKVVVHHSRNIILEEEKLVFVSWLGESEASRIAVMV